jgi:pilus assembly protein CpaF
VSLSTAAWERVREGKAPDAHEVAAVAREESGMLGSGRVLESTRELTSRVLGAGPLDPWLADPDVTDVALNGDGSVWVDRGRGMEAVEVRLGPQEARVLAVRLAGTAGRRLDDSCPWVDGQLPSGARLHAILPPLVTGGPHITIRVPARTHLTLEELAARGMFPAGWISVLEAIVTSRLAFVVSGGTGAGKTTLLAALLGRVSPTDRLLVVEDVRELHIDHPHVLRLEARPANVEGAGEVTLTTLVRQALRMRPDRIVVGEVRGAEVRELLAALNTGHEGGSGTLHANSPLDVVARFEALGALAGLAPEAVRVQLASAIRLVLHVERVSGLRRLTSVSVLARPTEGSQLRVEEAVGFDGGRSTRGPGWAVLSRLTGSEPRWEP